MVRGGASRARSAGLGGRTRSRGYPGCVTDEQDQDALIERLRVIEEQPIGSRAEAYDAVVRELRSALESADAS